MNSLPNAGARNAGTALADAFRATRQATTDLCRSLQPEDMVVQTMPDVSPTKWHLAHTTWFFENFLLAPHLPGYRVFHERYGYLFNSYYYTVGSMYPRPQRGLLSRPAVREIMDYRAHVDAAMEALLTTRADDAELAALVTLGINHEQQHQELLLTDIKHVLSLNPLQPAYRELPAARGKTPDALQYFSRGEGLVEIGHAGAGFCFDNELPRHRALLYPHAVGSRLITNSEYREFIRAGGYTTPELWLSDGWTTVQAQSWSRPLYWSEDLAREFTLGGVRELDPHAPVCHVSYYEADAYARWAGARLPTEVEWETWASNAPVAGNFVERGMLHPLPLAQVAAAAPAQLFGDVWEWTSSPYVNYPGYRPPAGSIGEYNGKFMCNQWVLRGGSCATAQSHIRATYRNFFYPDARWQFSGIRLAKDAT